ncbi:unnamed protein product [Psylliodes chrysocephalus]|uniref:U2A'/phosphoprotein 32 family A C-terminal domain-containing protein n=1 Tax=Psylliodes chrysocephalus TaxID=3402493 RepID=A0A9P0GER5_9CUCU|nr:unnamed protein product [Psylliodes chrysocephala]
MSKRLTEEMVIARTKISDLSKIKRLNCWGSELVDVSLLRKMPSVEVLSLSINKINSLSDFQFCTRLEELYVRQNDIQDICQVMYLQSLPNLKNLWLGENPCANVDGYRLAIIRALPQLQKLDNIQITQEELKESQRRGKILIHPEDYQEESEEEYIPPPSPQQRGTRSRDQYSETEYSPTRESPTAKEDIRTTDYEETEDSEENYPKEEGSEESHGQSPPIQTTPPRREVPRRNYSPEPEYVERRQANYERESPSRQQQQQYYEKSSPTNTSFEETITETTNYRETKMVNSQSANCIKEYTNGDRYCQSHAGSELSVPQAVDRKERYSCPAAAHRPPFVRRPVTRNSNILSAVLCLVKELDYPSLEVVDMAVRCRMDELVE